MSDELPQGWAETTVGEVAENISYGFTAKATTAPVGPRFLRITDIQNGSVQWDSVPHCELPKGKAGNYGLRTGDIVFARTGATTGKSFRIGSCPEAVFASYLIRVRPSPSTLPEFLANFFRTASYWNQISENLSGSAQPNCNASKLATISLPLAPLAEQRRIVAKLEALLGKVDTSKQRLAKIFVPLKRFRQSVLAAACSGRLTADWREENPSDHATGDTELPRGWRRQTVEDLIPKGGIFDGPFGSNLKSDDYTESGIRVIRLENIGQLHFINDKQTFISRKKYETLKKHTVGEGDIIFASFIADEVRACVLPQLSTKAIAKADCFCLRPKSELVNRQYLVFQLISQKSYDILAENVHGATRPRINTTQLRKLKVRICPLPEQQEIVRRVEGLFALADQLEVRLAKARGQVDALTPSLLARAFAGKLVPQDPNDEPASVLLERIRQERNGTINKRYAKEKTNRTSPPRNRKSKRR